MRTRYTYDTSRKLIARCPGVHFVWIMGADNLRSFHRWQKWRDIANLVPIAWSTASARAFTPPPAPPARRSRASAFREEAAKSLPRRRPPAWVFLHGLKSPLSSTALRALRRKP